MKRQIIATLLLSCVLGALACTSAIVSGRLTANGRPLLWKNRDTDDQNNKVERIAASPGGYEYVALFNATDTANANAWMGFNKHCLLQCELRHGETHGPGGAPHGTRP